MAIFQKLIVSALLISLFASCKKDSDEAVTPQPVTPETPFTPASTAGIPAPWNKIYYATQIYVDGSFMVIKTHSRPDHKSPYYQGTSWQSSMYEAYNGPGPFAINPNRIATSNLTFRIPMTPTVNPAPAATPGGPIGVSINGVPLFNQYAAMNAPLTNEIVSFDQYNGHPQQQGQYHYHVEPLYITATKGKNALIGWLLDGYPVYGPEENGVTVTNAMLDTYHGHTTVTADYPGGIYHYHFTADAPYMNGAGFRGVAGTVTQ